MSRMVSFSVLVGIIIVIGFLFYRVMISFLLPLFLAALLVVMFRPLHRWILEKCKGRPRVAAGLTTAAVMAIVLVPAGLILTSAAIEASAMVGRITDETFLTQLAEQQERLGLNMRFADELRFFEATFDQLAEGTSQGATFLIERQALENLTTSLGEFEVKLRRELDLPEDKDEERTTASPERPDRQTDIGDEDTGPNEATADQPKSLLGEYKEIAEAVRRAGGPSPASMTSAGSESDAAREDTPVAAEEASRLGSVNSQIHFKDAASKFRNFKTRLLFEQFLRAQGRNTAGPYEGMEEPIARLIEFVNPTEEELAGIKEQIFDFSLFREIGGATGAFALRIIFGIVIVVISVYFFLSDGPSMVTSFMRLSPLDDRHERELIDEFDRASRAVVVATLLSAVVQGLLGGIGYWFCGVGSVFLLTVLTTVFALIPFVGAAAVWVPVSCYLLFFEGRYGAAGLLAVYGTAIVSMADNVIKPLVLHGQSNLHPLLALLSVLGGVQALGPIGVLVGPMVVVFLQTLLNILHRELTSLEKS